MIDLTSAREWNLWWFRVSLLKRATNLAFLATGGRYICWECQHPATEQVHESCRGFRQWIDRGGTLD